MVFVHSLKHSPDSAWISVFVDDSIIGLRKYCSLEHTIHQLRMEKQKRMKKAHHNHHHHSDSETSIGIVMYNG